MNSIRFRIIGLSSLSIIGVSLVMVLLILNKNADTQRVVSNQASTTLGKTVLDQVLTLGKYQAAELGSRFLAAEKIANSLSGSSLTYREFHAGEAGSRGRVLKFLQGS